MPGIGCTSTEGLGCVWGRGGVGVVAGFVIGTNGLALGLSTNSLAFGLSVDFLTELSFMPSPVLSPSSPSILSLTEPDASEPGVAPGTTLPSLSSVALPGGPMETALTPSALLARPLGFPVSTQALGSSEGMPGGGGCCCGWGGSCCCG